MRSQNNLPMGILVNSTIITPKKSKCVPIVLMNTNSYNVWIRQPLLVADLVEIDHCPWDYQSSMSCDGDEVTMSFHPVPSPEVQGEILSSAINDSPDNDKPDETSERPNFGPRPDFNNPSFDFRKELEWLPFPVNLGEVEMTRAQQVGFLQLVYDNQSIFSLCDEDLGLCDHLKHKIPTTMDKPVYLPHHTILVQLQGIIHPSHSLYASQVVVVCKKVMYWL